MCGRKNTIMLPYISAKDFTSAQAADAFEASSLRPGITGVSDSTNTPSGAFLNEDGTIAILDFADNGPSMKAARSFDAIRSLKHNAKNRCGEAPSGTTWRTQNYGITWPSHPTKKMVEFYG